MNKNNNIIIDFLNQFYIVNKNITLENINYDINTKNFDVILLFKLNKNLNTNTTKIIYLNDLDTNDKFYNDYYDKSIEKVSEYIFYIKNFLNQNVQDILFNDFVINNNEINDKIIIGAGLYLIHSNYYKVFVHKYSNFEDIYCFFFLDKN